MDTYVGRRTAGEGVWVAFGVAAELAEHARIGDVVEVYTPSRHVARVRITRTGQPFTRAGVRCAYGYLEDANTQEGDA